MNRARNDQATMDFDFLNDLNDSQRQAVEYCDGPSLVIAGAGSGKTRVLTYKIAYLLRLGTKPWNILALTFTNKAAREMKRRVGELVGEDVSGRLHMGTFHSTFARILRAEAARIGYQPNYTIYDEEDSKGLIKAILKEMGLDDGYSVGNVRARIGKAKNALLLPEGYAKRPELLRRDREARMGRLHEIYAAYCERLRQANAMDFDDLLVNTYFLFSNDEETRKRYAAHFHHVLVDEYQDTNSVQKEILWQLSKEHRHVCAVGDDAQSIYAFRGANIDNILEFQSLYGDSRLFKLERNYRSTKRIVMAANSLIRHNTRQIPKDVYSENEMGGMIRVRRAYGDREEAMLVSRDIKRMALKGCSYSDFAVLYRMNHLSRAIEDDMVRENIPYRVYGGLAFYQRKEIKDILAYFRLAINPDDEEAFRRVVNYPKRGIGETSVARVAKAAADGGVSLWEVVNDPESHGLQVGGTTLGKLRAFQGLITGYRELLDDMDAHELGRHIVKTSGISDDLHMGTTSEDRSRQDNVEELLNSLQDFVARRREEGRGDSAGLRDYVQEVALQTSLDAGQDDATERVSIMTVHSAKGLEFPYVYVIGLEEGIFPCSQSMERERDMEEERRLLYVAITRAMKRCTLSYSRFRYRFGRQEAMSPSRFLDDIDLRHLEYVDTDGGEGREKPPGASPGGGESRREGRPATRPVAGGKPWEAGRRDGRPMPGTIPPRRAKTGEGAAAKPSRPSGPKGVAVGDVIEHERFGRGRVTLLEGSGENAKATVEFENAGRKQLLLKFARYRIVE